MKLEEMPEEIPLGRAEDLKGKKFGHLTPIYRCKPIGKMTTWVCKCDCSEDSYVAVIAPHLKDGHTKSCGCILSQDLTGRKYGDLTVLYSVGGRHYKTRKMWMCKCERCGRTQKFTASSLNQKDGPKKCSYCQYYKDLKGQRFGKLVAVEWTNEKDYKGNWIWNCVCDCDPNKIVKVSSGNLLNGNTKSCGCLYSIGEVKIKKLLEENNISFKAQKTFEDCVYPETSGLLRFDFYLPDYNCCIEYDGPLHYETKNCGWSNQENLEETKKRDSFKNDYCHSHNIVIKRIPHWELEKITIENILDNTYIV